MAKSAPAFAADCARKMVSRVDGAPTPAMTGMSFVVGDASRISLVAAMRSRLSSVLFAAVVRVWLFLYLRS